MHTLDTATAKIALDSHSSVALDRFKFLQPNTAVKQRMAGVIGTGRAEISSLIAESNGSVPCREIAQSVRGTQSALLELLPEKHRAEMKGYLRGKLEEARVQLGLKKPKKKKFTIGNVTTDNEIAKKGTPPVTGEQQEVLVQPEKIYTHEAFCAQELLPIMRSVLSVYPKIHPAELAAFERSASLPIEIDEDVDFYNQLAGCLMRIAVHADENNGDVVHILKRFTDTLMSQFSDQNEREQIREIVTRMEEFLDSRYVAS